ncbi:GTPase Era [Alicyclobacillus fodiniaquatilis]|uniref:GTPase Era n=1 Tax=Alicyclobacillus fodiniaquatilis TaxID=1661150 RepID=A0ABW4JRP8_9BACL
MSYKSGFVAIVGRPNVGKSTLLNAVVGQKVAIMSKRAQTTRNRIRGVVTSPAAQIIFIDTPGIHTPHHRLGEYMVDVATQTLREVDIVLVVVDANTGVQPVEEELAKQLQGVKTPVFLVLNKVDLVEKPRLLERISQYQSLFSFDEYVPISALKQDQTDVLLHLIEQRLPEGPKFYPDDMVSDYPEQFIISEIIREKVLKLTEEEVPHAVMVEVEQMERRNEQTLYIHAVIYTERDSQKGILIGKQGQMLRRVGEMARRELEGLLGTKMYLELWVKVKKDWRNRPTMLRQFGFHEES